MKMDCLFVLDVRSAVRSELVPSVTVFLAGQYDDTDACSCWTRIPFQRQHFIVHLRFMTSHAPAVAIGRSILSSYTTQLYRSITFLDELTSYNNSLPDEERDVSKACDVNVA